MTTEIFTVNQNIGVVEAGTVDGEMITFNHSLGILEVRDDDGNLLTILEPSVDVLQVVTNDLIGPAGPAGQKGEPGAPGEQGPPGERGPQGPYPPPTFDQRFADATTVWTIVHNLDTFPVVTLYDLEENEISGDVTKPDRNTVVVNFEVPFAGTARLKA